jgi:hypothetical protein
VGASSSGPLASAHSVRLIDAALALWTVGWILIGVAVSRDIASLAELSDNTVTVGTALRGSGQTIARLGEIPLFGERLADVGRRIERSGREVQASGISARTNIDHLSKLLGTSLAIVPTVPLVLLYLPFRLGRAREVRAIRRASGRPGGDPMLVEFLARRALTNLSYDRLREVSADPYGDVAAGTFGPLAEAELRRLGLRKRLG